MPVPGFEIAADVHGRDAAGLAVGALLNVNVSAVSNGGFLPGDRDTVLEQLWMIRIAATVDCYIKFTEGAGTATSSDMLFQAGTESQKLPPGTNYVSAITVAGGAGKLQVAFLT